MRGQKCPRLELWWLEVWTRTAQMKFIVRPNEAKMQTLHFGVELGDTRDTEKSTRILQIDALKESEFRSH